ncbi:hypothetical protein BKA67DRAFT_25715 [Truncatella angustata]|uniref:Protein kinase domain-containing protein n=1 Tax=Truncatella angustata TaxID=152316 RepID=A0A9P9A1M5_9PEZI|nr:uncharacterized protein BKA67DRAFT_25715 [Truncatella angustata]KAH6659716.1 hypothetical protein BKA67DRAFT_25715 [Truncatella angustata]
MATQTDPTSHELHSDNTNNNNNNNNNNNRFSALLKRFLGRHNIPATSTISTEEPQSSAPEASSTSSILRRASRRVVPGLPRAKTFKRQQSEVREKLEVDKPTQAERRAVSVDRRGLHPLRNVSSNRSQQLPRASAPEFLNNTFSVAADGDALLVPQSPAEERPSLNVSGIDASDVDPEPEEPSALAKIPSREPSTADARSTTTSMYEAQIHDELESKWILNLSMHFRDKSKREKFFVTYREKEFSWRRVTISLDYRNAPPESLESDLQKTKFQREKSAKIYDAIRESLQDIQFYDTVTNLKLQTTDGRLHVHVVEDVNEIIHFPIVRTVQHLRCRRIRERDIMFDSHMSGFVYKVRVNGETLIKKEIPGPDTVDEFLYEVNALNSLRFSSDTISFYGIVVDDEDQKVKGLLIDYAEKGALIDIIYDAQEHGLDLPWATREKWSRQIVQGLADIHEAGFVQGDFTLSNIVIDENDNAKIIDINRRGCPVGWEPPEATPLIESNQRIFMYIGVKSDLYQLGMVLWALATLEDEPEAHRRPLHLDPEITVPRWYRRMMEVCLSDNPRLRLQATVLVAMFPEHIQEDYDQIDPPSISVDDGHSVQQYMVEGYGRNGHPVIRTVTPQSDTYFPNMDYESGVTSPGLSDDAYYYPPRGRSPPSPLPSNLDECDSSYLGRNAKWAENDSTPSVSDAGNNESQLGTPKNIEKASVREITKQLEGTLKTIGAQAEEKDAIRHDSVYEDAESIDWEPRTESVQTPKIFVEEIGESFNQNQSKNRLSEDLTSACEPSQHKDPTVAGAALQSSLSQDQAVVPNTSSVPKKTGNMDDNPHLLLQSSPLLHQDNNSRDDNNTADSSYMPPENPPVTSAAFEVPPSEPKFSPSHDVATDLTGIGTGYSAEDEYRNPSCSDEDLGIITSTAANQNVASQA